MATNDSIKKLKAFLDKQYKEDQFKHYVSWDSISDEFIQTMPTGSMLLDDLLSTKQGLVMGSISQWFGNYGSAKSLLAAFIAASYQKAGLPVLYIDAENKFQPDFALETAGFNAMDENTCLFSQEQSAAVVYNMIEQAADSGFKLVVVDSLDACLTPAQEASEIGEVQMMQHARFNSEALRKVNGACNRAKMSVIFISQSRTHMIQGGGSYEETSGGNAVKFYSTIRNKVRKVKVIESKETGEAIGITVEVRNVKNGAGIPFKTIELTILFNKGFDTFGETIELAIKYGVINKKGGWFDYHAFGPKPTQGKENVIEWFRNNNDAYLVLQKETETAMKESKNKKSLKNTVAVGDEEVNTETGEIVDSEPVVEDMETGEKVVRGKRGKK
jgi:recombination protein RecA